MNEQRGTTDRQLAYLRYLAREAHEAHEAHEAGLPYLPINALSARAVHDWIDYLRLVVQADRNVRADLKRMKRERAETSPYLRTPALSQALDGYRPPYDWVPAAFDHDHALDTFLTEDGHDVVFCALCGEEW
jgi:hypothetical protein